MAAGDASQGWKTIRLVGPYGLHALDQRRLLCDQALMQNGLEQVTKDAMALSSREKLVLAEFLLESSATDPEAEAAWDAEVCDRIRAIDEGRVIGVSYEEVMHAAEGQLAR